MYKIKSPTVESIIIASQNTYPDEFFSLLGGDKEKKVVDELIVVPAIYGKRFALIKTHLIPFDSRILGSVHSHPSPNSYPSKGDLNVFRKMGDLHLIIAFPFDIDTIKAFDSRGKKQEIEII